MNAAKLILKRTIQLTSAIAIASALGACSTSEDTTASADAADFDSKAIVKIDGSSTVFPVTEAVAEEFQIDTKVKVTVGISGTGGGFKKFCRGETDISGASRPIKQKEIDKCKEAGIEFIELPIAFDALTVVINPANEFAKEMTVAELKTIWGPEAQETIISWNQVNPAWPDQPLKLFGPGADSGTFDYFTEAVVGKSKSSRGDFTASEDDNVLVTGVAGDKGGIGYFGYAYYEENKDKLSAVAISEDAGKAGVLPSKESIEDGTYTPLARPIFIYVKKSAAEEKAHVKAFIDYYLANGRPLIEEVKYVPLPAEDQAAVVAHWNALKTGTGFVGGKSEVGVKIKDLLDRVR